MKLVSMANCKVLLFFLIISVNNINAQAGLGDQKFGSNGYVQAYFTYQDELFDMAVSKSGYIYCAGSSAGETTKQGKDYTVVKITPEGKVDTLFGQKGRTFKDFGSKYESANSIDISPNGRIVIGGNNGTGEFLVIAYDSTGAIDSTLGSDGMVGYNYQFKQLKIRDLKVLDNGKILVCGNSFYGSGNELMLCRLNINGSIDTSFGKDNGFTLDHTISTEEYGDKIILTDEGKILIVGQSSQRGMVACFDSFGIIDTSYGKNGFAIVNLKINQYTTDKFSGALQKDKKLIVSGYNPIISTGEKSNFMITRLLENGKIDSSFGTDGIAVADYVDHENDYANDVVIQADGKILVGGAIYRNTFRAFRFGVVRFNEDGSIDTSFGTNGFGFNLGNSINTLFITSDGYLLAGGHSVQDFGFGIAKFILTNPTKVNSQSIAPSTYSLSQNFPNPFNPSTAINFSIPQNEFVSLKIYNMLGKEITTLVNSYLTAGSHSVVFNSDQLSYQLSSGVYFYRIETPTFKQTKKLILLK